MQYWTYTHSSARTVLHAQFCTYIHTYIYIGVRAHTHNEMHCYCSWMQVDRNGCPSREIPRIRKLVLNCQQACWPYRVSNQTDSIFFQVNDLKVKLAWQWQNGTEHVPHPAVTKSLLIYLSIFFLCLFIWLDSEWAHFDGNSRRSLYTQGQLETRDTCRITSALTDWLVVTHSTCPSSLRYLVAHPS